MRTGNYQLELNQSFKTYKDFQLVMKVIYKVVF